MEDLSLLRKNRKMEFLKIKIIGTVRRMENLIFKYEINLLTQPWKIQKNSIFKNEDLLENRCIWRTRKFQFLKTIITWKNAVGGAACAEKLNI